MNKKFVMFLIILLAFLLRFQNFDKCDINDRGQSALGVVENLPPLEHWLSVPLFFVTNNYDYAPIILNIILDLLIVVLLFDMGSMLFGVRFGFIFSFLYAIVPIAILNVKYVSPETVETFSILLMIYFFVKTEIMKNDSFFIKISLYFSFVVGCFAKQQTVFIMIPFFIYGIIKYKGGIIKNQVYQIMVLGCLPYVLFVFSHPEMLGAIYIYFNQPVLGGGLLHKLIVFVSNIVYFILVTTILCALYFFRPKKEDNTTLFMKILLLFYIIFVFFLMPYIHLLILPIIYFSSLYLLTNKHFKHILFAMTIFTILLVIIPIPYFSIMSQTKCEIEKIGHVPIVMAFFNRLDNKPDIYYYSFWNKNREFFDKLFENETIVIVAGNIGQDVKYNVHKIVRLPSILNTEYAKNVHYAFLFYSINYTYQNVSIWDKEYSNYIIDNSELVLSGNLSPIRYVELRRFNMLRTNFNRSFRDIVNKSRVSLGFER